MTEFTIYQVDAFTKQVFKGNPAAVIPLADWIDADVMLRVAQENNLAETAFFVLSEDDAADFHLRWFTPGAEIDLCGHATLATAHILFNELDWYRDIVRFSTETAGILTVKRLDNGQLQLDFPARAGVEMDVSDDIIKALGARPEQLLRARDHMAVFAHAEDVRACRPNMDLIADLNQDGVIITAPGDEEGIDFVSRFFAPAHGIPEDPVTGSAHCTLVPYWAERLDKTSLHAKQISSRGGDLYCHNEAGRVLMAGHAVTYLRGTVDF